MAKKLHAAQTTDSPYAGGLKISITSTEGQIPIEGATVSIALTESPDVILDTLTTDASGQTDVVELPRLPWITVCHLPNNDPIPNIILQ